MAAALVFGTAWSLVMPPRINEAYKKRDGFGVSYFAEAFGTNAFKRYLADPETEAWFRAHGMPDDAGLSSPSQYPGSEIDDYAAWNVFFAELRARPVWMRSARGRCQEAFLSYMLSHPAKVLSHFFDEVPIMLQASPNPVYGEPVRTLGPLSRAFFWGSGKSLWRGDWGFLAVLCTLLGLAVAGVKARPSPPLLIAGGVVSAMSIALMFQAWLGSAYRDCPPCRTRHATIASRPPHDRRRPARRPDRAATRAPPIKASAELPADGPKTRRPERPRTDPSRFVSVFGPTGGERKKVRPSSDHARNYVGIGADRQDKSLVSGLAKYVKS